MSLEQLTKTQIILLALLASFVTSIATGIVTAALMSQAPPAVARTVDQIIEKTVQQVAPPSQTAAVGETVKETIVTNKEAAPAAIAAAEKSIIKIFAANDPAHTIVARGIITGNDGAAETSAGALKAGIAYDALLPDGSTAPLVLGSVSSSSALQAITFAATSSAAFVPATLIDARKLELGESVVRIGGAADDVVAQGMLAELPENGALQADVSSDMPGAVLIDLTGSVVGLTTETSLALGQNFYTTPASN